MTVGMRCGTPWTYTLLSMPEQWLSMNFKQPFQIKPKSDVLDETKKKKRWQENENHDENTKFGKNEMSWMATSAKPKTLWGPLSSPLPNNAQTVIPGA